MHQSWPGGSRSKGECGHKPHRVLWEGVGEAGVADLASAGLDNFGGPALRAVLMVCLPRDASGQNSVPECRCLVERRERGVDSGFIGLHIKGVITDKLFAASRNELTLRGPVPPLSTSR